MSKKSKKTLEKLKTAFFLLYHFENSLVTPRFFCLNILNTSRSYFSEIFTNFLGPVFRINRNMAVFRLKSLYFDTKDAF